MDKSRLLMTDDGKTFLVKNIDRDFHCQFGMVKKDDLQSKVGDVVETNKGKKIYILNPMNKDRFAKIKRNAQIMPSKDVGFIISEIGIDKNTVVIDAGAGSGGACLSFSLIAKKVYTYDIREDHLEIVKENKKYMDIDNLEVGFKDITKDKLDTTKADVINLDIPNPWDALENCMKHLKPGGFLVSYSPTIPQVSDLVEKVSDDDRIVYLKSVETSEREWEFSGRKIRPKTKQRIGHSGFISFFRKVMS